MSSLTQDVYLTLRSALLTCRLKPGEKLKVADLCSRLDAGSSAVREALSRLAAERLVTFEPQRGFHVAPISLAELRDLTFARCEVEASCIRRSIELGDIAWEGHVISALHRLSRTPIWSPDDPNAVNEPWIKVHTEFHAALVSACDSQRLLDIRAQLSSQIDRYRHLSMPLAHNERDIEREHREIAEAALSRNQLTAVDLLTRHFRRTADIVVNALPISEA